MKIFSTFKYFRIPPPIVTASFACFMYLVSSAYDFSWPIPIKIWLVILLLVIALLLLFPAVFNFYKKDTTVNPLKPENASVLVVEGVYRFSRNPMYLGMALLLLSWSVYLANPLNFIVFVLYIAYMTEFQIKFEEKALEKVFGESFLVYMKKVRRWL